MPETMEVSAVVKLVEARDLLRAALPWLKDEKTIKNIMIFLKATK